MYVTVVIEELFSIGFGQSAGGHSPEDFNREVLAVLLGELAEGAEAIEAGN